MSTSSDFILEAKSREDVGKGASRRLRRLAGEIPAIIYGAGKEPSMITLLHKDIMHAIENEAFFSHIITLKVDGKDESVVIKDLQRHPAKPKVLHADFLRVSADQAIHVKVPLHFIDEEKAIGVKQGGGIISHLINELEISCLPKDLPEFIPVYMAELDIGESIHIADLALPEGVSSVDLTHGEESNLAVASIHAPKAAVEEEPAAEAGDDSADSGDSAEKTDGE